MEEIVTVALATGENTAAVENLETKTDEIEQKAEETAEKVSLLADDVRRIFSELYDAKYADMQLLSDRVAALEAKMPDIHQASEPEAKVTVIETPAPVKKARKFVKGLW